MWWDTNCQQSEFSTSCSTKRMVICAGIRTSLIAMCRRSVDLPTPVRKWSEVPVLVTIKLRTISAYEAIPTSVCKGQGRTRAVIIKYHHEYESRLSAKRTGYGLNQNWRLSKEDGCLCSCSSQHCLHPLDWSDNIEIGIRLGDIVQFTFMNISSYVCFKIKELTVTSDGITVVYLSPVLIQ